MVRQGWYSDHPSGGGSFHVLLLLTAMALAAATGWFIGDDELRGRVGGWWDRQSTSWTATSPPVQPEQVSTLTASNVPVVAASTPPPSPTAFLTLISPVTETPTPGPPATARPRPTPIPPTVTPLPPTPTPTYIPPHLRHMEYKEYMLELINLERARAGVGPVTLGTNNAVQLKAESAIENCAGSHWGLDGLKPYMRYSLAGGYQSNAENGSGSHYCYGDSDRVRKIEDIKNEVREAMRGWMDSPGHRRNLLKATHRKVNIGLAWDRYNTAAYQHFEGDYIEYSSVPSLRDGRLALQGVLRNGATLIDDDDLGIQVFYDPPPHALTRGQLARTYCYSNGLYVASLRQPLPPNWFYRTHQFTITTKPCVDPYDVPSDAKPPRTPSEAMSIFEESYSASNSRPSTTNTVPWITAIAWRQNTNSFEVSADIGQVLNKYGPGVYTVMVWAQLLGGDGVVSQYSIFHGVTPPTGYSG